VVHRDRCAWQPVLHLQAGQQTGPPRYLSIHNLSNCANGGVDVLPRHQPHVDQRLGMGWNHALELAAPHQRAGRDRAAQSFKRRSSSARMRRRVEPQLLQP
jgi:hypothetical protein